MIQLLQILGVELIPPLTHLSSGGSGLDLDDVPPTVGLIIMNIGTEEKMSIT